MEHRYKVTFIFYNATFSVEEGRTFKEKEIKKTDRLYEDFGEFRGTVEYKLALGQSDGLPITCGGITLEKDDDGVYVKIEAPTGCISHGIDYDTRIVREGEHGKVGFSCHESTMGDWYDEVGCCAEVTVEKCDD